MYFIQKSSRLNTGKTQRTIYIPHLQSDTLSLLITKARNGHNDARNRKTLHAPHEENAYASSSPGNANNGYYASAKNCATSCHGSNFLCSPHLGLPASFSWPAPTSPSSYGTNAAPSLTGHFFWPMGYSIRTSSNFYWHNSS